MSLPSCTKVHFGSRHFARSLSFPDREKPYIESVRGSLAPKVSPKPIHLELLLGRWLDDWADGRGMVMTELRFYFVRGEMKPSSLLPNGRWPLDAPKDARERPRFSPDIAVEIWSPSDRKKRLAEKIALYLAHGSRIVIVVYPEKREIAFHHAGGMEAFPASGKHRVPGYDDLILDADALFGDLESVFFS